MTPKWLNRVSGTVTIQDYVDRVVDDLRAYHDTTTQMLQDEIDRRVSELIRERDARFIELSARVETASTALDHRLEAMNEFRAQMREQAATFVRKDSLAQTEDLITNRLDAIESALDRARGRMSVYAGIVAAAVGIVTIITLAVNHIRF